MTESLLRQIPQKTPREQEPEHRSAASIACISKGNGGPVTGLNEMPLAKKDDLFIRFPGQDRVEPRDRVSALAPNLGERFLFWRSP